jgi:hypothetical protein
MIAGKKYLERAFLHQAEAVFIIEADRLVEFAGGI